MIRLRRARHILAMLTACGLLATSAGCVPGGMLSSAMSFGVGWLVGAMTAPTTTQMTCYRNGEEVDCSELAGL